MSRNKPGGTIMTAKNYQFDKAPKRITLLGDAKRPEPAQHIIEFPGGAVEVSRCEDGTYWAHIIVNRREAIPDCDGLKSRIGEVVASRVDWGKGVVGLDEPVEGEIEQIAVRVRSR